MILTIACEKGGTSKTSTAGSIAQALAYKGKTTLLVDCDPQASATLVYGAEDRKGGTYSLITGKEKAEDLIQTTSAGNIIPASPLLDRLDVELNKEPGRDSFLKAGLEPIKEKYDCIVIDTAPGLSTTLIQALVAADSVIIPLLCDPQALAGLHKIMETIEEVRNPRFNLNDSLKVAAVVLTQYQPRATLTRQYEDLIKEQCKEMGIYLAKTRIRRAIALQEAQAVRESLYSYNPKCNPAQDYLQLCEEIGLLKKTKKNTTKGRRKTK